MGENGETTGGGGGPNPNPTEAIDEVDEVLEAQNKEWRINEFCSKLIHPCPGQGALHGGDQGCHEEGHRDLSA